MIIPCPQCSAKISSLALCCPHCGRAEELIQQCVALQVSEPGQIPKAATQEVREQTEADANVRLLLSYAHGFAGEEAIQIAQM